ncbi:cilia- and flagella-associated protein 45-like [Neosynchiropus ocellatus]
MPFFQKPLQAEKSKSSDKRAKTRNTAVKSSKMGPHTRNRLERSTTLKSTSLEQLVLRSKQAEKGAERTRPSGNEIRKQMLESDIKDQQGMSIIKLERQVPTKANVVKEDKWRYRRDQEDEIKDLKTMILSAKSQALRDDQVQEKEKNMSDMKKRDKALEAAMIELDRKAYNDMMQRAARHKRYRFREMEQIHEQIEERQQQKTLERYLSKKEKWYIQETYERKAEEARKAQEKKKEDERLLCLEMVSYNNKIVRAREQKELERKHAELEEREYIKKKLEEEAAYEEEQKRIRREKAIQSAKELAQHQASKDKQAQQDEQRARRIQEKEFEEWERKEKELAAKRKQALLDLQRAREEQILNKDHMRCMELNDKKAEFERLLKIQEEARRKAKEDKDTYQEKMRNFTKDVGQQVKEHEFKAFMENCKISKENELKNIEAQDTRQRLDDFKMMELREFRAMGYPEKYSNYLEKKIR